MNPPIRLTDAQREAVALHAVGQHLMRNPALCRVHVSVPPSGVPQPTRLQIVSDARDELHALLAWATSLGVEHVRVRRPSGNVHLHVHGHLHGLFAPGAGYHQRIDVWSGVDGLQRGGLVHDDRVEIADLVAAAALQASSADLGSALALVRSGGRG